MLLRQLAAFLCLSASVLANTYFLTNDDVLEGKKTGEVVEEEKKSIRIKVHKAKIHHKNIVHKKREVATQGDRPLQLLILTDGSELSGFFARQKNGDVLVSGNDYLPDNYRFLAKNVREVRGLEKVNVILDSDQTLGGHVSKTAVDHVVIEKVFQSVVIPETSIARVEVRNDIIIPPFKPKKATSTKLPSPGSLALGFGYVLVPSGARAETQAGITMMSRFDAPIENFMSLFRRRSRSVDLTAAIELGYSIFASDPSVAHNPHVILGPIWRPLRLRRGWLSLAALGGAAFRFENDGSESSSAMVWMVAAEVGFDYAIGRPLLLLRLRSQLMPGSFVAVGPLLGISYPL